MTTIQASDFIANTAKYLDFSMTHPLAIVNELGEMLKISKPKKSKASEGRRATKEEIEAIIQSRQEIERGECYVKRPDETVEEFFDRIDADPEGTMLCNTVEWKKSHMC